MPLLTMISARLRRRRAEADLVWRLATQRQDDAARIRREASRTQAEAYAEAIERILRQATTLRRLPGR